METLRVSVRHWASMSVPEMKNAKRAETGCYQVIKNDISTGNHF